MASHYTVVQFLPDPLTDERINIGVVAYSANTTEVRFVEDWSRVRNFWGRNPAGLRTATREISEALVETPSLFEDPAQVQQIVGEWTHSVQFSPPRGSLLEPAELIERISATMLREVVHSRRGNTKATVVRNARRSLERYMRDIVTDDPEDTEELVRVRDTVSGLVEPHQVDLAVRNGHVMVAAQAIAFPKETSSRVQQQIAATAWVLKDISEAHDHPELAVIVAPPADKRRDDYARAESLFGDLDAELVMAGQVDRWAEGVAHRVQRELASHD